MTTLCTDSYLCNTRHGQWLMSNYGLGKPRQRSRVRVSALVVLPPLLFRNVSYQCVCLCPVVGFERKEIRTSKPLRIDTKQWSIGHRLTICPISARVLVVQRSHLVSHKRFATTAWYGRCCAVLHSALWNGCSKGTLVTAEFYSQRKRP